MTNEQAEVEKTFTANIHFFPALFCLRTHHYHYRVTLLAFDAHVLYCI